MAERLTARERVRRAIARGAESVEGVAEITGLAAPKLRKHIEALLSSGRIERVAWGRYVATGARAVLRTPAAPRRLTPAAVPGIGDRTVANLFRAIVRDPDLADYIRRHDRAIQARPVPRAVAMSMVATTAYVAMLRTWMRAIATGNAHLVEPEAVGQPVVRRVKRSDDQRVPGTGQIWTFSPRGAASLAAAVSAGRLMIGLVARGFGWRPLVSPMNYALLIASMFADDETIDRVVGDLSRTDREHFGAYRARRQRARMARRGWLMPVAPRAKGRQRRHAR